MCARVYVCVFKYIFRNKLKVLVSTFLCFRQLWRELDYGFVVSLSLRGERKCPVLTPCGCKRLMTGRRLCLHTLKMCCAALGLDFWNTGYSKCGLEAAGSFAGSACVLVVFLPSVGKPVYFGVGIPVI